MRNGHNLEHRKAWCNCEWFVQEGRLWRRHTERVEEVCWTDKEIRGVLTAAGFAEIEVWDAAQFVKRDTATTEACRSFYRARKRLAARA